VKGEWQISGHGSQCDENFKFSDANDDKIVQDTEHGAALTCSG